MACRRPHWEGRATLPCPFPRGANSGTIAT
jgi:hypothetical protein